MQLTRGNDAVTCVASAAALPKRWRMRRATGAEVFADRSLPASQWQAGVDSPGLGDGLLMPLLGTARASTPA